jgi:hypothetical protein
MPNIGYSTPSFDWAVWFAIQVRDAIRLKHYSIRTEEAYVNWIRRYILFHNKRHPTEMGAPQVEAFLTHLAAKDNVAASTQNPCTEPAEVRPSAPSSSSTARCSTRT